MELTDTRPACSDAKKAFTKRMESLRKYGFVLAAVLFVGVAFTASDFLTAPTAGWKDAAELFCQWVVLLLALAPALYLLAVQRWVFAILFPCICLLSAILTWFRYTTGAVLTTMIIDATLDNDTALSLELISPWLVALSLASLGVALLFVRYRFRKIRFRHPVGHAVVAAACMAAMFSIPRIQRPVAQRIPFNLYFMARLYVAEREAALTHRDPFPGTVDCEDGERPLVVCVIGESLRADHLALNGYPRPTTPYLSREDVISFPHIYSPYTHTNSSVPYLLTPADSLQPERAYSSRSFIDLFRRCGYYAAWLANQEQAKTYSYFMNECDTLVYIHPEKSPYVFDRWVDGDMLPAFDALMARPESDRSLVILHTIGSHWYYPSHYPDNFQRFVPVAKSRIVRSNTREELINAYDNTVCYTDYFLFQLIERLRTRNAVLFFLSDHGEALGEDGQWLHAGDAPAMHHPAGLVWMSPRYREAYPGRFARLQAQKDRRCRTDFLFPTIAEVVGIRSEAINPALSLFR
jgi:glucan phosphoethanolaminetransferase (alkaline phosphatase superfamily)